MAFLKVRNAFPKSVHCITHTGYAYTIYDLYRTDKSNVFAAQDGGPNVWTVHNVPRIQPRGSVTTVIIFGVSVRTENQGVPEVTAWPANNSNTACILSMTRFPRSTMLHVLPCLTIPRAVRRNKQTETRRIPFVTSHSPPARSLFVFNP